jgi:hypothetical protein
MADCFVSYKREDEARVAPVVQGLRAAGLATWWDRDIPGGERWRETIVADLDAARCVLVCWSEGSARPAGAYVREEAERAKARGVLLPLLLDRVDPPFGFGEVQALDLAGWKGGARDRRWRHVVATARAIVQAEPRPKPPAGKVKRFASWGAALALIAAVIGFVNDLVGMQAMACRASWLRETCRSLGWGGIPSMAEEQAWQRMRTARTCDGYRTYLDRYPQGAFAAEAQARLVALRTEAVVTWKPRTQTLPLAVPRPSEASVSEEGARLMVANSVVTEAARACKAFENSDAYRLVREAQPTDKGWHCAREKDGWRCGFDGEVLCDLEERTTTMREVCG